MRPKTLPQHSQVIQSQSELMESATLGKATSLREEKLWIQNQLHFVWKLTLFCILFMVDVLGKYILGLTCWIKLLFIPLTLYCIKWTALLIWRVSIVTHPLSEDTSFLQSLFIFAPSFICGRKIAMKYVISCSLICLVDYCHFYKCCRLDIYTHLLSHCQKVSYLHYFLWILSA